jgi:DNA polymerase/3'-5' exonuclease PolX
MPMLYDFSPDLREILGRRAERLWAGHGGPILVYTDALRKVLDDPKQIESARAELLMARASGAEPPVATAQTAQTPDTDGKRPWRQAHADAEAFRELFVGMYSRWEFGGSVRRRKDFVGDVEHIVIPAWGDTPAAGGLFGQTERINLMLQRADELLAAGTIAKHVYPVNHADGTTGETTKWGDKYRGCEFRGFNHEIFSAHEGNWGAIFAIRTGPGEFSKRLVTVMQGCGYRQVDGFVERISDGQRIAMPDEETYFKICGLAYLKPEARQ